MRRGACWSSAPWLLALCLVLSASAAASEGAPRWVWRRAAMHTGFALALPAAAAELPPPVAAALARDLDAIVERVAFVANEWRAGTPLARVNAGAGGWVAAPPELRALLRLALEVARRSGGAFDPSWAALRGLWRFPPRREAAPGEVPGSSPFAADDVPAPVVPGTLQLAACAALVDFRAVDIDDARGAIRLRRKGMALGLGGIAKGWALDRLRARLEAAGVSAFALDAGGQLLLRGGLGPARPYQIGIRDPRGRGPDDALALLAVGDASVSTSADDERTFEAAGVRYHHLLDPRSGRPARALRSATIVVALSVADAGARADALSTAVFVAGPQRGATLCAALGPEGGCVLVDAAGALHVSPTLRPRLRARAGLVVYPLPAAAGREASP